MKFEKLNLDDIYPYPNNPRINDDAVPVVQESIRQCSYITPIIVDEEHVIIAGETRWKALKQNGDEEAFCLICDHLTEEQKKKYRFLDNKTGEKALWDFIKLDAELEGLDLGDFDFFRMTSDIETKPLPDRDISGSAEFDLEDFDDEKFKYQCPNCGFRFN